MWIARNKDGDLRLFEFPPKRYHEGAMLPSKLTGFNDAKNIRNRVLVTVLRESLLKQLDNGAFKPKKLKREKIKEVLLSFRRTLQETARSECTNCSVTTFDYI